MSAFGNVAWQAEAVLGKAGIFLARRYGSLCSPTAQPSEEVGLGGGGTQRTTVTTAHSEATRPKGPRWRGPRYGKIINTVSTFRGEFHGMAKIKFCDEMLVLCQR